MLKKIVATLVFVGLSISFIHIGSANTNEGKDPKQIFEDAKCTTCHSIDSKGVETRKKTDKTVDLSKLDEGHDAAFWISYLKKNENLNNKKHPVAFRGTDEELAAMINWLMTAESAE